MSLNPKSHRIDKCCQFYFGPNNSDHIYSANVTTITWTAARNTEVAASLTAKWQSSLLFSGSYASFFIVLKKHIYTASNTYVDRD